MNTNTTTTHRIPVLLATGLACLLATNCIDDADTDGSQDEYRWGDEEDSDGLEDDVDGHDHADLDALADVLRVTVQPSEMESSDSDQLFIEVALENTTNDPVTFLKWGTPFDELGSNMFEVTHEGANAEYIGPVVKRGTPVESDFLTIGPGQTLTALINISERYATPAAGEYTIRYRGTITTTERGVGHVRSNAIVGVQQHELVYPEYLDPRSTGLSFTSCDAAEQETLERSFGLARSFADSALSNLESTAATHRSQSPRYTTWFGSYTEDRYDDVEAVFGAIDSTLATQSIHFDCSCSSNAFAYVYPNQPYKIYMCNSFWSASDIGTDSKAGTIVHEVSHFTLVADTDDHAYGHSAAKALATNDPDDAIANADSYEYFAENNSWLPMVAGTTFNHNTDGFWGDWGEFKSCPTGQFVYGYRVRSESDQGSGDDTGLNDIELYCASPNSQEYTKIWSAFTNWGTFSDPKFCGGNNPVVGFDMKIQADQGSGDDTAANVIDLYCDPSGFISATTQTSLGSWTETEYCPENQAVTGLLTRVEADQGLGDNSALNGLRLVCDDY